MRLFYCRSSPNSPSTESQPRLRKRPITVILINLSSKHIIYCFLWERRKKKCTKKSLIGFCHQTKTQKQNKKLQFIFFWFAIQFLRFRSKKISSVIKLILFSFSVLICYLLALEWLFSTPCERRRDSGKISLVSNKFKSNLMGLRMTRLICVLDRRKYFGWNVLNKRR